MIDASVQAKQSLDSLVGEIADEFLRRQENGEHPDVEEYAARYPEAAELLRNVLRSLKVLELSGAEGAAPTPPEDLGQLGDFHLLREVGRGGMGIVYEAEQLSLKRRVAVKILPFAATMDARQLQRFQNEARAAAGLHHTNIVPVYFVGSERGVHYYAMQFIEGQDLASAVTQLRAQAGHKEIAPRPAETVDAPAGQPAASPSADTRPIAGLSTERSTRSAEYFRTVARLGIQAAEALDHAHQQGILHRDVKPANLMVDAAGQLWITDFGLARIQSDTQLTMTGDLLGTLRYMSPEQALAKRVVVDHRTDIYSLGATLYELLTLEPVFTGKDRQELLRQIAFEEPRRPRQWNRAIPQELETIVQKAMERNPVDRYATAQELADDLRNFLEDRPIRARRPSLRNRSAKWCRRHKPLVLGIGAVVLTILFFGVAVLWREHQEQQRQQSALERGVDEDLRLAESLQKQEHWPEALEVLERASNRLARSGPPQLRERVDQRRKNVAIVASLEKARLQRAAGATDDFDYRGAAQAYAAAFASFDLDLAKLTPEEAAERIRTSPIRTQLVAALDDWAMNTERVNPGSEKVILTVARLADNDPWRQRLRDLNLNGDGVALERIAGEAAVLDQPPDYLVALSKLLETRVAAIRLLRQAQQRYPVDFWVNFDLASLLHLESLTKPEGVDSYEAIGFYRAALSLRPNCPTVYVRLSVLLLGQGKIAEAEAACRKAIALRPDDAEAYTDLANVFDQQGKFEEAEAACRKAIALRPDFAGAYNNLSIALLDQGKQEEAEAACRKAIALMPDLAKAHNSLGSVLNDEGRLAEAEAAYREAIKLRPDLAAAYINLGHVTEHLGRPVEAETAYRQALELLPDNAETHSDLGSSLLKQGRLAEAEAANRRAIALQPDLVVGYVNLGAVLRQEGRFEESLAAIRRCHELGTRQKDWPYPSAQWVRDAERLAALAPRFTALLAGKDQPANASERVTLAEMCVVQKNTLNAAAARFYADAFAAEPKLAEELGSHRYNAACAAALAGCGEGKDAAALEELERARLRRQSLDWLRADLSSWTRQLETDPDKVRGALEKQMAHWLADSDFNGVRGPEALAKLPEAERAEWQKFWEEVAALRQRAQGKEK